MRTWLIGWVLLLGANARADMDARRALSADVAAAITVRPVGVGGALRRIGSGWEAMIRRSLGLPQAVAPLDPTVVAALGIDPAAPAWAGVRAFRGGTHLRVAVPLDNERMADALVQTAAGVTRIAMARTPRGAWHNATGGRSPAVVRLDGKLLVADVLLDAERPPSSAELERLVPLRPPRAFAMERGALRRIGPSTALAIWVDLAAAVQLGIARGERNVRAAVVGLDPEMRARVVRAGAAEIDHCRTAARSLPATFEDLLVAVAITGPDELHAELTLGGKQTSLDPLRPRAGATRATRGLTAALGDADVALSLLEPFLAQVLAPAPTGYTLADETMKECGWPATPLVLRSWPTVLATRLRTASRAGARAIPEEIARFLSGVRGAALALSLSGKDDSSPMTKQLAALIEIEPAVRGDLDRALLGRFGAVTPLKLATRQISAFGVPSFPWATGEGPIVAVDVVPQPDATLVGFGPRELVRQLLERVGPAPRRDAGPATTIATLQVSERGLGRILREAVGPSAPGTTLVDGVRKIDAELVLDPTWLRIDASFGLRDAQK